MTTRRLRRSRLRPLPAPRRGTGAGGGGGLLLRRLVPCALALLVAAALPVQAAEPRHLVKDPYYGDSLFYFFQQRYFTSLTDLMVSQHFGRVSHHVDEAELLRGGLYLSYGLHREAGEIFTRLIEKNANPQVRDRAWYYLAKIRYQRDLPAEAEEALSHVGSTLPPDLEEDRRLLQANLLMARHAYDEAAKVLQTMAESPRAGVYVRYNLGVALIKSGQAAQDLGRVAQGVALLDQIGRSDAEGAEMRALRDKANVALGFSALQGGDPGKAREYLQRVRLNGMLANKALLGFGWAAASLRQPKEALVPWTELASRDTSDPAVLEAKLAVPYAFGELGAYAQSLELYNDAIATFDRERVHLDESIAAIRSGKLVDDLVARNPGDEMGWFWNIESLPRMPHAEYLAPILAENDFQEAFKNYRDLVYLSKNLQQWRDNLAVYSDMLATRRQAFVERLPRILQQEGGAGLARVEQDGAGLKRELAWAQAHQNVFAFADSGEQALAERLARARATLADAPGAALPDAQRQQAQERLRRVEGALTWQLTQEFPVRVWEAKKRLGEVDAEVAQAKSHDAALLDAQRSEPAHFQQFASRIVQLDERIRTLTPELAALMREQKQYIEQLAVARLEHEKQQLAVYATQARFAVARIYDRANSSKEPDRAPAQ